MIKNHGLDLQKEANDQSDKDYVYRIGASKSCISQKVSNLSSYYPIGEVQKTSKGDMMDCASREPVNDHETKVTGLVTEKILHYSTIKWLLDNGYIINGRVVLSDAFIAILSGTTKRGNSIIAPWKAVENNGMIPKAMLPLEKNMSWEEYHNPKRITQAMLDLGKEYKKRMPTNYDRAYEKDFDHILNNENNLLGIVVKAWSRPINGIYPRIEGDFNHVVMGTKGKYLPIYDNYIDSFDGDFIKQLAPNYKVLGYAYRSIIGENVIDPDPKKKMEIKIDLKLLGKCYKFGFFRDIANDSGAKSYVGEDLITSLNNWILSKEHKSYERAIYFLNTTGLIKLFQDKSFIGKYIKGRMEKNKERK